MPMSIRSEVYVNSVSCKVPYTLCDLNKREADAMRMSGPYTLPFENILPALEPRQVREKLKGFQMEYHQLLNAAIAACGRPRHEVPLITIMRALLGYPPDDPGGPTAMKWLDVLEKCDTKSYEDLRRIWQHGWNNHELLDAIVGIFYGDGQTVLRDRNARKP